MINTHIVTMHQTAKYFARTQNELSTSVFLKAIADSFVSIYVPIYLLIHGLNLRSVMAYCVIVFVVTFVSTQIALLLCQTLGIKKTLVSGIGFTALFYWLLHQLSPLSSYQLMAATDGLAIGFYYGAYNMLLTRSIVKGKEMKSYSVVQTIGLFAGIAGPLIGSLFIRQLSFQNLFLIVTGILATATAPLFFSRDFKTRREPLQLGSAFKGNKAQRRIDRSVFLQGMLYGAGTIWPLYLYMHYPHIVALGLLTTLSAAVVAIGTFMAGKVIDRHQRFAYGFGALLYAPTWITRLLFVTPIGLSANAFAASLLGIMPTMAVAKDIFHGAKQSSNRSAHFARIEIYMDLGRVSIFAVTFLVSNLTTMFILSSVAAFTYMSCRPRRSAKLKARPSLVSS